MATTLDWPTGPNPRPAVPADPRDFPFVREEQRATLRDVDRSTGRYTPPNSGATNATAGATQAGAPQPQAGNVGANSARAPVVEPVGGGGNTGAGVQSDVAKRTGLRGGWDSAKAGANAAGQFGKSTVSVLASPTGVGSVAGVVEGYSQLKDYNALAATPGVTDDQLKRQAIEGVSGTTARGLLTAAGTAAGGALGSLAGPVGTYGGAVAGGALANKAFDNTRDRLASTGLALSKGEFGDATNAFFGFPGSYGPVSDKARAQAAATAAAQPTAPQTPTQASYSNEGRNYPASAGGKAFYRGDVNSNYDFTKDLASVPANLPNDLRNGVIYKTKDANGGTVYSGMNVGSKASIVDGAGRTLRAIDASIPQGAAERFVGRDESGNFLTPEAAEMRSLRLSGGKTASGFDPSSALTGAQQAQYNREVAEAQAINAAGAMVGAQSSIADQVKELRAAGIKVSNQTLRQLLSDQTSRANNRDSNSTSVRTTGMNNSTSLRTTGMNNEVSLRGQDMDLQGRLLPKQMELAQAARMRELRADIFKQAGGDPMKAAMISQGYGLDPKDFLDTAKAAQDFGANAAKNADRRMESLAISYDKDGKAYVDPGKLAQVRASVSEMAPGFQGASEPEQQAVMPQIVAGETMRQEINRTQNNSRWDRLVGNRKPDRTKLDLRDAKMDGTAGAWDALGAEVEYGDIALRLGDGSRQFISKEKWNQTQRELLEAESKKK